MSQIRICRPGHPVNPDDFIDLGPATGRVTHTRGSIYGGVLVTPLGQPKPTGKQLEAKRANERRWYAAKKDRETCGFVMPTYGEPCARRKDHRPANDHRSRRNLDDIARRRWATV